MPSRLLEGRKLILICTIIGLLAGCTKSRSETATEEIQDTPAPRAAPITPASPKPDMMKYMPMKEYAAAYYHYKLQKEKAQKLASDLETCRQINDDMQEDIRRWQNLYYAFTCEPHEESSNED